MRGPQVGLGAVLPGRMTAELGEDGVVVVLIGMRFNHWWRVDKWVFMLLAMARMLGHLASCGPPLRMPRIMPLSVPMSVR
jgi:Domain of unknown function (DUF4188)